MYPSTPGASTSRAALSVADGDVKEIWFDDGNIVVRAGKRIFRVWKSFLAARSPVFLDMLSFPPNEDQDYIHGCPVVTLSDDEDEVTYFFKALFHANFFMPPPTPTLYVIAAGILRLSHKYDVDYLFHRALLHLNFLTPMSLQAFDERRENPTTPLIFHILINFWNLIHETGTLWMLPSIGYYLCTRLTISEVIHGQPGKRSTLTPHHQWLILNAKNEMDTVIRGNQGFLRWDKVDGCQTRARCNTKRLKYQKRHDVDHQTALSGAGMDWVALDVCSICGDASKAFHNTKRAAAWDNMPELFGSPEWPKLLEMRDKMMEEKQPAADDDALL